MSGFRLSKGGRIDRTRKVTIRFDGEPIEAFAGDTLASALLASGRRVLARSFKLHRPRGLMAAGGEEPNVLVRVEADGYRDLTARATELPVWDGMTVRGTGGWPSVNVDLGAAAQLASFLLPAGFYYKTFMWPGWRFWEPSIRKAAASELLEAALAPGRHDRINDRTDLLIVGAGPAGLAAARDAANASIDTLLVDDQPEIGGSLLWEGGDVPTAPGGSVRTLTNAAVIAAYDNDVFIVLERIPRPDAPPALRIRQVRARRVVIAAGAVERPMLFTGNDRPGVMLATAVRRYIRQYGVAPGKRVALLLSDASGIETVTACRKAGIEIAAVLDVRGSGATPLAVETEVLRGAYPVATHGYMGLQGIDVRVPGETALRSIDCDVLAMAGGWSPLVHLIAHRGHRPAWDDTRGAVLPASLPKNWTFAYEGASARPWVAPEGNRKRIWVDFKNDATAADVALAVRENYRSVEHLKRYTTIGMATDQGRTSNINALALLADETGSPIVSAGTTTFRPPFQPVKMSAVAAGRMGEHYAPRRLLPADPAHRELGARFQDFGGWQRPEWYGVNGKNKEAAVAAEIAAVRTALGLYDGSPLGKIEVVGPDAADFLDRLYAADMQSLKPGRVRYSVMLDDNGIIFDDGVVQRLDQNRYLLSPSSANAERVHQWLEEWLQTEWPSLRVGIFPVTSDWANIALAGPRARDVLALLGPDFDISNDAFPHMSFRGGTLAGLPARVARVSFTGELQYEIAVPARYGNALWRYAMTAGEIFGIRPVGIEAWLRMRIEKGYLHVGTDTDGRTTPMDIGLRKAVEKKTRDFIGRRALFRRAMAEPGRAELVGLVATDGGTLEAGARVLDSITDVPPCPTGGHVTSACLSRAAGAYVGLTLLRDGNARIGETVAVWSLGKKTLAKVTAPVFYDPTGARMKA